MWRFQQSLVIFVFLVGILVEFASSHVHTTVNGVEWAMNEDEPPVRYAMEETMVLVTGRHCHVRSPVPVPQIAQLNSKFVFPELPKLFVELALFMDNAMLKHFQKEFGEERAKERMMKYASAFLSEMRILYLQSSINQDVGIIVTHVEIFETQPPELAGEKHHFGMSTEIAEAFCTWQEGRNPPAGTKGHWDHALLLTGFDLHAPETNGIAGLAPIGGMCSSMWSCSIIEGNNLGRAFVAAHELGHSLGMFHDGDKNECAINCCLMSPRNGAGKTQWSECSNRELKSFVLELTNRSKSVDEDPMCLQDVPSVVEPNNLDVNTMPGQLFTADEQCQIAYGLHFRLRVPPTVAFEDICRVLWCNDESTTVISAHPALDGTYCGDRKWCMDGSCVPWNKPGPEPAPVNGNWAEWSSVVDTECTSCVIRGTARIRKQHRACRNPSYGKILFFSYEHFLSLEPII
uniref:Peptidase M12B domain-containing protein n=1 Tax=Plectus sambesii TaxID=2011161 RepID=A0A914XFT2_9BILA